MGRTSPDLPAPPTGRRCSDCGVRCAVFRGRWLLMSRTPNPLHSPHAYRLIRPFAFKEKDYLLMTANQRNIRRFSYEFIFGMLDMLPGMILTNQAGPLQNITALTLINLPNFNSSSLISSIPHGHVQKSLPGHVRHFLPHPDGIQYRAGGAWEPWMLQCHHHHHLNIDLHQVVICSICHHRFLRRVRKTCSSRPV